MERIIYGIYGASGFGKEVMPLLKQHIGFTDESENNLFFVDDSMGDNESKTLNSCQVLNFDAFLNIDASKYYIAIAIADSKIREQLTLKCLENNIQLFDLAANNIVKLDNVSIAQGSILCPFVTLTSNIQIGQGFHANIYSYVAHDCIIGNYVTFAPSVKCNGNVIIEDYAYIGTGAIIKQGKSNRPLRIGKGAIVSAGSFVTKNVPDGVTVFGNPAIKFSKENISRQRNVQ